MKILSHTSLKPFHTFGLDAKASKIIEAHDINDFVQIWDQYSKEPKLLIGEGSNVIFCDDFEGIVILNCLKGISLEETSSQWLLHVAGGENWHELVRWSVEKGMSGLENLALIPGLVGSAPIQNIGAYGLEFKDRCEYVDVLMLDSGKIKRFTNDACEFAYRDSIFKNQLKDKAVIVAVGLKLPKLWAPVIAYGALSELGNKLELTGCDVFNKVCEIRSDKLPDPHEMGNAGSFFKNPVVPKSIADTLLKTYENMPCYAVNENEVKLAAGWLIEQAGLKGRVLGGAAVHHKQALVLINTGAATSKDVLSLAKDVAQEVYLQFGVKLEHEVRFIGKNQEIMWDEACQ